MQFNTAFAFMLCGLALLSGQLVHRRFYVLAAIPSILGLLTIVEYLGGWNVGIDEFFFESYNTVKTSHPGRMSPWTAVGFLIGGLTISSLAQNSFSHSVWAAAIAGSCVVAIGLGHVFGYLIGEEAPFGMKNATYMAFHTSVAFLLMGIGLLAQIWQFDVSQRSKTLWPQWLLACTVVLGIFVVYSLYLLNASGENYFIRALINKHVLNLKTGMGNVLREHGLALIRINERWKFMNGQPQELFSMDAAHYIQDISGLRSIGILASSGQLEWTVPNTPVPQHLTRRLTEVSLEKWHTLVMGQRTLKVSFEKLDEKTVGLLVLLPQGDDRHLLAVYDWAAFMQPLVARGLERDFSLEVMDPLTSQLIYKNEVENQPISETWHRKSLWNISGMKLSGDITPTVRWVNRQYGIHSYLILILGSLLIGALVWILRNLMRLRSRSQELTVVLDSLNNEIETRKMAEDKLRHVLQFNQLLLSSVGEGVYGVDNEGATIFVNPAASRMLGYEADELLGKGMHEMVHHSYPNRIAYPRDECPMYAAFRNERVHHSESEVLWRKDGTAFPVSYTSTPIISEDGNCHGAVVIFADIEQRKKQEIEIQNLLNLNKMQILKLQQLTELAEQLNTKRTLIDTMQLIAEQSRLIIGAHQATVSFTVDKKWSQAITGLSLSEKYADYRSYDVPPDGSGIYSLVCETNRPFRLTQKEIEAHPRWKGFGKEAAAHPPMRGWLAVPLMDGNGRNWGLIQLSDKNEGEFTASDEALMVQVARLASSAIEIQRLHEELESKVRERTKDLRTINGHLEEQVAQRESYEKQLLNKNRDLENLLYIISHDLKEPVRGIQNFSQLVVDTCRDNLPEDGIGYLQRVINGGKRLTQLLSEIQAFASVRQLRMPEKEVDLNELVNEAMARLHLAIEETQAQITIAPNLPHVCIDPMWGTQAIYNLLANALKFHEKDHPPEIDIQPCLENTEFPQEIGLVVHDRGPGVKERYRERVFQLFKRAVSRSIPGTGAGLAIVRQVAERHGGHAWVTARAGGGSSFFLTFPMRIENRQQKELEKA